jgi:ElaB/YqjD/DUF883 family membrane-anchored ribosome-binding protein
MENKKNITRISGIRQNAHEGVDKVIDKAEDISKKSNAEIDHLKERAKLVKDNIDGYIQENPAKSLLIAAGTGAAIGTVVAATMIRKKV